MRVFTRWDEEFSTGETNELLHKLSFTLSTRISNSDLRQRLVASITNNDVYTLCNLDLDYTALSVADAISARQILAFYSKRRDIDLGFDKAAVSYGKFKEAEELCRQTNTIFKLHGQGRFQFRPCVEQVLFIAQRKISRILGDVPSLSSLFFRFGPGATTKVKKSDASPRMKLSHGLQCSEDLLPIVKELLEEMPGLTPFGESDSVTCDVDVMPSRLCFVPKNAKTERAIATEPGLNVMYQSGIGEYMKARLKRFGIDITDQTQNQRLAREGSITRALATLDLSNASDTVSKELVAHLLPIDWFLLLDHGKTSEIETPDGILFQEKFSSMGNGFTFPLETLIFYALASASVDVFENAYEERRVSVYGDDVIIPCYAYDLFSTVLVACGFELNKKKSFSTGPFRESCGKDYLSGIDIRPVYVKDRLTCADVFRLHNFFKRNYDEEICQLLLDYVPKHLAIFGPDGYGDGHLLGDWSPRPHKRNLGWSGYTFDTFTFKARKCYRALPGDFVYPSYSIYVKGGPAALHPFGSERLENPLEKENSPPAVYDKRGRLCDILPGRKGYKRISIYTLSC